jgi:Transposase DDE domain
MCVLLSTPACFRAPARARALMGTPAFAKSSDERKTVEMRLARLKTHHRFECLRLRGLSGARDEFHLAAIVQNLT